MTTSHSATDFLPSHLLPQEIDLYLRLGVTSIPLKPCSKEPFVRWTQENWNPSREELENWAQKEEINWAVRCSPELAVLAFDEEASFHDFVASHPLPPDTPIIRTGRGYHIWLRPKRPIPAQRLDGFELKCLGSYVVAPPSIHPSVFQYTFKIPPSRGLPEVDLEELLEVPLWPVGLRRTWIAA